MNDIIFFSYEDYSKFSRGNTNNKINLYIELVMEELPTQLKRKKYRITPRLEVVEGFENREVKGYAIKVDGSQRIEQFIKKYIPYVIVRKNIS